MRRAVLELSDAFSQVVEKHRKAKGFSRVALAERAGLHQTYIGLLERGKRSPNLDTASAIAKALGVPLSSLITETERFAKPIKKAVMLDWPQSYFLRIQGAETKEKNNIQIYIYSFLFGG